MYRYWCCYCHSWDTFKNICDFYDSYYIVIPTATPFKYLLVEIYEVDDPIILPVD